MSLIDLVQQQLGPDGVQDISRQLGTDPQTTQKAIDAALPMMLGGMAGAAQQPGGEGAVQAALSAPGAGGDALGGLGGLLGSGGGGGGGVGDILGSILGGQRDTVQDGVAQSSGLDRGKVLQLLVLLAPIVLRALQNRQSSPGAQPGGLGAGPQQEANAPSPDAGGILGRVLGGLGG